MSVCSIYWIGHSGSKAVRHATQVSADQGRTDHEGSDRG
jgi:hypothetical protein